MKTIIKIPLYVEVETEDGLDRKIISESFRGHFIPEFFNSLKIIDLLSYFESRQLRFLKEAIGSKARFKFISDRDLFTGNKT